MGFFWEVNNLELNIYALYSTLIEYVIERFTMLSTLLNFLPAGQIFGTLVPISMAVGIGIGFFGSFSTVRKHLHV